MSTRRFGILNNLLGGELSDNNIFTDERRSIGVRHHPDRCWTTSIGSKRQWWSERYIILTTKKVL